MVIVLFFVVQELGFHSSYWSGDAITWLQELGFHSSYWSGDAITWLQELKQY